MTRPEDPETPEYLLGTGDHELARLELQHGVWGEVTAGLLDRARIAEGWSCLDVGCGPGLVSAELLQRVGAGGRVVAVDGSPRWTALLRGRAESEGWSNLSVVHERIEQLELQSGSFDLVFMRWVLSFLPEPAEVLRRLAGLLRPGGKLVIQDYNHEGVSLFPESEGFRAAIRATREWYRRSGGDAWVAGRLPELAREAGLQGLEIHPRVLCGGPGSPAFRWADAFFPHHLAAMGEQGLLTEREQRLFLREWAERRADGDSLFFSPIVVGAICRRPGG